MHPLRAALAASLLTALLAGTAHASTPLHYDEAIDGDIPLGTVRDFNLDIGSNVIKGQLHAITLPADGKMDVDFDPFMLNLASGQRITGMSVSFSYDDTTQNTLRSEWAWQVTAFPSNTTNTGCFVVLGTSAICKGVEAQSGDLLGGLPATASRYLVNQGSVYLWQNPSLPSGGYLNYTFSVNVAPVPEPSQWLLMLGALPLLYWARRSRRPAQR